MIGEIFNVVLLNPMINFLVILNSALFGSFGLAIIAFTVVVRLITFPLTVRQFHATRTMQQIQPQIQEINQRVSDPRLRQQETMKLYRESGVNPLGCLAPMLLQFPVLIALYYSIRQALPASPEALTSLHGHLYSWSFIQHAVPVSEHFLGLDLRATGNLLMVVLVALTTWAQQKTTVTATPLTDQKARQQQQMMQYMMPLMFAFFALSFPAGVSLYWVVNSGVGIGFNVATYGFPLLNIELLVGTRVRAPAVTASSTGKIPRNRRR